MPAPDGPRGLGVLFQCASGELCRTNDAFTEDSAGNSHVSAIVSKSLDTSKHDHAESGRLFFLELSAGRVLSANPDGSDLKVIVDEGRRLPDGLAVDVVMRHLYWTNMGTLEANDGSITVNRAPMDVAQGARKAPEILFPDLMEGIGLALDRKRGRMFITDFGGSVYSANPDGSARKTLLFAHGN